MFSKVISSKEVEQICKKYFEHYNLFEYSDFTVDSFDVKPASEKTMGFLSQHLLLSVTTADNVSENIEKLTFFVKALPCIIAEHADYVKEAMAFDKEIVMFEKFISKASGQGNTKWAPNYFFARMNDLIVFENLYSSEFQISKNSSDSFDRNHLTFALKAIAAMHASSLAMEHREPEFMEKFSKNDLYENFYPNPKSGNIRVKTIENTIRTTCHLATMILGHKFDTKRLNTKLMEIFELCKSSTKYRNVFSHGDLWGNNIMFRYHGQSDKPNEAIIVDFQLTRWAPPAFDLMTFLMMCTRPEFRDEYLQQLLDDYYVFLEHELVTYGLNVETEISRNEFDETCKFYSRVSSLEAAMFSHMIFLPEKYLSNVFSNAENYNNFLMISRNDLCENAFKNDPEYRNKMINILSTLVKTIM